jgi:hypothetical protein
MRHILHGAIAGRGRAGPAVPRRCLGSPNIPQMLTVCLVLVRLVQYFFKRTIRRKSHEIQTFLLFY